MTLLVGALAAGLLLAAPGQARAVEATDLGNPHGGDFGEVGAELRGGVGGFTGDIGRLTGPGVEWGVAALGRPSDIFGFEVSYEGGRYPVSDPRVREDVGIFRNGFLGMAKAYAPLELPVEPYVGAGVGITYVNPGEAAEDIMQNDFMFEIPLALGADYEFGENLHAGVRAGYNALLGESYGNPAVGGNPGGGLLAAELSVGGSF